jgi:hypothetical protein
MMGRGVWRSSCLEVEAVVWEERGDGSYHIGW